MIGCYYRFLGGDLINAHVKIREMLLTMMSMTKPDCTNPHPSRLCVRSAADECFVYFSAIFKVLTFLRPIQII